jgi:hypothetical protein
MLKIETWYLKSRVNVFNTNFRTSFLLLEEIRLNFFVPQFKPTFFGCTIFFFGILDYFRKPSTLAHDSLLKKRVVHCSHKVFNYFFYSSFTKENIVKNLM